MKTLLCIRASLVFVVVGLFATNTYADPAPSAMPADADQAYFQGLLEKQTPSIMSMKILLQVQITAMGNTDEREVNIDSNAVVITKDGLLMMSSDAFNGPQRMSQRMRRGGRGGGRGGGGGGGGDFDVVAEPLEISVLIPGTEEEREATLLATDSKLNIAFVKLDDVAGLDLHPVTFSGDTKIALGEELTGINLEPAALDYAPYFETVRVTGQIHQPRSMWRVSGGFGERGLPLFNKDGKAVGILSPQEMPDDGTGQAGFGGGQERTFLIPSNAVEGAIKQAIKKATDEKNKAAATG
ncbi:MAG: hypothetical protein P8J86_10560 [Phycisphaerales bacterium]|nr:hypothetical protein [Phycisphaerales bacterium]